MSLTPSPVIATVWPLSFKALTKICFCFGETLPKTIYSSHDFFNSSSLKSEVSTYFSLLGIPASVAISLTVLGLSPEITLIFTPCSLKYSNVSLAFSLISFLKIIKAKGVTLLFLFSPNKTTRQPLSAYSLILLDKSAGCFLIINSGAPKTYLPSVNKTVLYLVSELKGVILTRV